jgi:hypothetical protein
MQLVRCGPSRRRERQRGRVPLRWYVHFRATSCRCQRSSVSGVTTVAISRNRPRPRRNARTASRRQSSSVNCRRRLRSWRRSTRFSSSRYRRTSRSSLSSHPVRSVSSNWNAEMSITAGVYFTGAKSSAARRRSSCGTLRLRFRSSLLPGSHLGN